MATTKYQFIIDLKESVLAPVKKIQKSFEGTKEKVDKVNNSIKGIGSSAGKLKAKLMSVNKTLGGLPALAAGAFAVTKVTEFGGAVVDTLAEFERFEAVLTNTLGSSSAAQKALADITEFASNTPFQVNELSESFVRLAGVNFKPTMNQMTRLGDLASSSGKSFDQLSEAVLDARNFEFERLKEFNIQAKKQGDEVALTFKGQTTIVKQSSSAVTDYLLSLGELNGVQGSMAAISKTTGGQLSNLVDKFTQLKLEIGQGLKPIVSAMIGILGSMVEKIRSMIAWVRQNSESIKFWAKAFFVATTAVLGFVAAMNASLIVATVISAITMPIVILRNTLVAVRLAALLFNAAIMANPIGALIGIVAGVVGAFIGLKTVFPEVYNSIKEWFGKAWDFVNDIFIKPVIGAFNKIKGFLGFGGDEGAELVKPNTVKSLKEVATDFKAIAENAGSAVSATAMKVKASTVKGASGLGDFLSGSSAKNIDTGIKMPKTSLATGGQSAVSKGVSNVVGAGKESKITNISIKSLVEVLNVHAASAKERPRAIKQEMEKVLLQAVNNINHAS